ASAPPGVAVRAEVLSPASARVLMTLEPADGPPDRGVAGRHTRRDERGHGGAGSVDVVRAPPPEPRALRVLLLSEPPDASGDRARSGVVHRFAGEHLDHVSRHVRARRVDHLTEVAERK